KNEIIKLNLKNFKKRSIDSSIKYGDISSGNNFIRAYKNNILTRLWTPGGTTTDYCSDLKLKAGD
ncbi:MAG: hypothetical protein ACE5D7_07450, partial [Fidelibacterota bacterium]